MKKEKGRIPPSEAQLRGDGLVGNGPALHPFLELIQAAGTAVEELAFLLGRAGVEAVVEMTARQSGGIGFGGGAGQGALPSGARKERAVGSRGSAGLRPEAEGIGERMLQMLAQALQRGRPEVLAAPKAAAAGKAAARLRPDEGPALKRLQEGCLGEHDLLILYLAGVRLRGQELIGAVGVDPQGFRHVLGVVAGSSAHGASVQSLLLDLVRRGLDAGRPRLFVIDASRALSRGVEKVFGAGQAVQRCRVGEVQRVCSRLPKRLAAEVRPEMRQAYRLPYRKGAALLRQRAEWLQLRHPGGAQSLQEGLEQALTISRLDLSASLRLCLGSTHIVRRALGGMGPARGRPLAAGQAAARAAALLLEAQKRFRKIQGWRELWMLDACLQEAGQAGPPAHEGRPPHPDPLESGSCQSGSCQH